MNKQKSIVMLVFALVLTLASFNSNAQYQKGDFLLNGGIGFGSYYGGGASLNINGEYSITDEIGIGPYLGYRSYNRGYSSYKYKYSFINFGFRGSYHFSKLFKINNEKLDIYGGAFLGYVTSNYTSDYAGSYIDPYGSSVQTGIHAGARYFFSPQFAAYGELSAGVRSSPVILGLSIKF